MAKVIHYYAHPGHRFSSINKAMWDASRQVENVMHVDLCREYPRYDINIDQEQARLLSHDIIVVQFPMFWYSAPALVKEWLDLTFEHGFAYGDGGSQLKGKWLMLAVSTSAPECAFSGKGYQHYPLRTFLTPFEQTARLSGMRFAAPYVRYGALEGSSQAHAEGFVRLLQALRNDRYNLEVAEASECIHHDTLPLNQPLHTEA
ncbi:MAG: NAD(P)H-dependent oxidoreductase [Parahaliea sp.]